MSLLYFLQYFPISKPTEWNNFKISWCETESHKISIYCYVSMTHHYYYAGSD